MVVVTVVDDFFKEAKEIPSSSLSLFMIIIKDGYCFWRMERKKE